MSEMRHRRGYVTKEADIAKAVLKEISLGSLKYQDFEILHMEQIKGGLNHCELAIVKTTHGNYFVEQITDDFGDIYTKVNRFI